MILNEIQCYSMIYNGIQWIAMIFNDIQWFSMIHNDLQWYTMIFIDIHWCTCLGLGAFDVGAQFLFKNCQFHVQWTIPKSCVLTGVVFSQIPDLFFQIIRECGKPNGKPGDGWCIIGFTWVYCSMYIDGTIKQPFANHILNCGLSFRVSHSNGSNHVWVLPCYTVYLAGSLHPSAGDRWIW